MPLLDIGWQDFERLTWRLAGARGTVEAAWTYGMPGQAQYGIDILVRLSNGDYEVWQSKRYAKFSAAQVTAAVDLFCRHKWVGKARCFVLAVACNLASTKVVEAMETARTRLKRKRIDFEPLDATRLTQDLKDQPDLIDDFFGRVWVHDVCVSKARADRSTNLLARTGGAISLPPGEGADDLAGSRWIVRQFSGGVRCGH